MQRTVDGEVLHQITFGIKNVHKATLRFVQGGERHPNVTIYSLNSVRGKIFRDSADAVVIVRAITTRTAGILIFIVLFSICCIRT